MRLSADYLYLLFELIEQHGVSPIALCQQLNIDSPLPEMVDISIVEQVLSYVNHHYSITNLSILMGMKSGASRHGFLGYAAKSSNTVAEALAIDANYLNNRIEGVSFTVTKINKASRITIKFNESDFGNPLPSSSLSPEMERFLSEFIFVALFSFFNELFPDKLLTAEVGFKHQQVGDFKAYQQHFPGIRFIFNCQEHYITLADEIMNLPLPTKDPVLKALSLQHYQRRVVSLSYTEKVAQLLASNTRSPMSLLAIAQSMALNERTLKRKLRAENTNYRTILTNLRLKKIDQLIIAERPTAERLAELMGYASYPSFIRLFKRWTGITYSAYKRKLLRQFIEKESRQNEQ